MSKEAWIREHEAIAADFVCGIFNEAEARLLLKELGINADDIDNEIEALKVEIKQEQMTIGTGCSDERLY